MVYLQIIPKDRGIFSENSDTPFAFDIVAIKNAFLLIGAAFQGARLFQQLVN